MTWPGILPNNWCQVPNLFNISNTAWIHEPKMQQNALYEGKFATNQREKEYQSTVLHVFFIIFITGLWGKANRVISPKHFNHLTFLSLIWYAIKLWKLANQDWKSQVKGPDQKKDDHFQPSWFDQIFLLNILPWLWQSLKDNFHPFLTVSTFNTIIGMRLYLYFGGSSLNAKVNEKIMISFKLTDFYLDIS